MTDATGDADVDENDSDYIYCSSVPVVVSIADPVNAVDADCVDIVVDGAPALVPVAGRFSQALPPFLVPAGLLRLMHARPPTALFHNTTSSSNGSTTLAPSPPRTRRGWARPAGGGARGRGQRRGDGRMGDGEEIRSSFSRWQL